MTDQLSFEDIDRKHSHRYADMDTSVAAAEGNESRRNNQQQRVLSALRGQPEGMTDYELSVATGILRGTAAKRRGELITRGLVIKTDEKRITDTNTQATVWRAV